MFSILNNHNSGVTRIIKLAVHPIIIYVLRLFVSTLIKNCVYDGLRNQLVYATRRIFRPLKKFSLNKMELKFSLFSTDFISPVH